jgi:hypothetical protein
MKSGRHFFTHKAPAFERRVPGNGDHSLVASQCLACGQIVSPRIEQSLERGESGIVLPHKVKRIGRKAAKKRASHAMDMEKLLHFSQQLYAHALTLQEVIRNQGQETYEVLRPRYERQAAQQFEIFYPRSKRTSGLRARGAGAGE